MVTLNIFRMIVKYDVIHVTSHTRLASCWHRNQKPLKDRPAIPSLTFIPHLLHAGQHHRHLTPWESKVCIHYPQAHPSTNKHPSQISTKSSKNTVPMRSKKARSRTNLGAKSRSTRPCRSTPSSSPSAAKANNSCPTRARRPHTSWDCSIAPSAS